MEALTIALLLAPFATIAFQDPPTPADLIERATYAEEERHDLAQAEELWAEALRAAEAAGDAAAKSDAEQGLTRVRSRRGKLPETRKAAPITELLARLWDEGEGTPPDTQETELQRAMELLAAHWSEEANVRSISVIHDLALYGDELVPLVEACLRQPPHFTGGTPPNPAFLVTLLSQIGTSAAHDAILRAFDSSDPLVRKAAVQNAPVELDALFRRALLDPVASIRNLALQRTRGTRDPEILASIRELACAGSESARRWICRNLPLEGVRAIEDWQLPTETLKDLLDQCRRSDCWGPLNEIGPELLALARESAVPNIRWCASGLLPDMVQKMRDEGKPMEELAAWARTAVAMRLDVVSMSLLTVGDRPAMLEALIEGLGRRERALNEEEQRQLGGMLSPAFDSRTASPAEWAELCGAIAARSLADGRPAPLPPALNQALLQFSSAVRNAPDPESLAACFAALPPEFREAGSSQHLLDLLEWMVRNLWRGPGHVDAPHGLVPLALLAASSYNEKEALVGADAILAIGDAHLLGDLLDRCIDHAQVRLKLGSRGRLIVALDPAYAAAEIGQRIEEQVTTVLAGQETRVAFDLLEWLPPELAVERIRALWVQIRDVHLRSDLFTSASQLDPAHAVQAFLVDVLSESLDYDPASVVKAVRGFGETLYEPALPLLESLLGNPEAEVRGAVLEAAAAYRTQREALEELRRWTRASQEADRSIAELTGLLRHESRAVRLGAVQALGAVRAASALPELVRMLADEDADLRQAVQAAIARIGD